MFCRREKARGVDHLWLPRDTLAFTNYKGLNFLLCIGTVEIIAQYFSVTLISRSNSAGAERRGKIETDIRIKYTFLGVCVCKQKICISEILQNLPNTLFNGRFTQNLGTCIADTGRGRKLAADTGIKHQLLAVSQLQRDFCLRFI